MPTKRANNEGTIRQRPDGRWEARYNAGYGADGKLIRRSVYGKTQAEVSKKLLSIRKTLEDGLYVEPSQMTVEAWLEVWLKEYVMPSRRSTTCDNYRNTMEKHLIPVIGKHKLQRLQTAHVQSAINTMVRNKYAPSTVLKCKNVIHGALEQAVRNQLVPRNVSTGVQLPKLEQEEIKTLSLDEQRAFIEVLPDTTTGRAIAFVLMTGLRVGELCGLRWKDIDGDIFTVNQTVRRAPNMEPGGKKTTIQTAKPKTKTSIRQIPISAKARALLDAQRKHQVQERLHYGACWTDNGLVFTAMLGTPLEVRNISRTLYLSLEAIGAAQRGIHALRHTFATRAIESGMDVRTLSEILGHADVATTLRLYVHSSMEAKRNSINLLDQYM